MILVTVRHQYYHPVRVVVYMYLAGHCLQLNVSIKRHTLYFFLHIVIDRDMLDSYSVWNSTKKDNFMENTFCQFVEVYV